VAIYIIPVKAREYVFTGVGCLSVCLSVTTITTKIVDGFVPDFMGRFLGVKGKTKIMFHYDWLRDVEVTVKKTL